MATLRFRLFITNKNYSSWSLRPWLLLKHFSIPFVEALAPLVPCTETSSTQPHFFEFSPTGKVPCLHDLTPPILTSADNTRESTTTEEPLIISESLAIVEYLAETHPDIPIWPQDPRARAFARSACAEIASSFDALRGDLSMNIGVRVQLGPDEPSERLMKDLERLRKLWEEGLRRFGGPWLCGREFCAADAFYVPVALRLVTYGVGDSVGDVGAKYGALLRGMEEVKAWCEDGKKEAWREPEHEKWVFGVKGRKLLEDVRATEWD